MEEKIKKLIGKEFREIITSYDGSVYLTTFKIGQFEKIDEETYFIYPKETKIINAVITKDQLEMLNVSNLEIKPNEVTIKKYIL